MRETLAYFKRERETHHFLEYLNLHKERLGRRALVRRVLQHPRQLL